MHSANLQDGCACRGDGSAARQSRAEGGRPRQRLQHGFARRHCSRNAKNAEGAPQASLPRRWVDEEQLETCASSASLIDLV